MSSNVGAEPSPELSRRLGYSLKHAQLRMHELSSAALAPLGLDGRQVAVLTVLAGHEPTSQLAAAKRLGIDRTTMVGFLDALESRGLVVRRADEGDRRRNVVELTAAGRRTLRAATAAVEAAERRFLAPLTAGAAEQFREALRALLTP